ncbi:dihydropteroate synthase [Sporomusa sphaeroides DSM 2875]|nr:dihydropteroate synthase [Sporomusa sphaeroides DSM 2875]
MNSFAMTSAWEIKMLDCSVSALMSTGFIARKLAGKQRELAGKTIIIPGLCQGAIDEIYQVTGCRVLRGPKDLKDLPIYFRGSVPGNSGVEENGVVHISESPIKILAEIVDAHRLTIDQIVSRARYYYEKGANIIDIGSSVDEPFPHLREVIRTLKTQGFAVSIDSHRQEDIIAANQAGVDLVLSVNSFNLELARELDCPVVIIPDDDGDLMPLYRNIEKLESWNKSYVVDPILPPLTMGLAESIGRCQEVRRHFPECAMLLGLSNVTELVDADSTGVNAMLAGIATELNINYLLTTEVSHRARGTVQETKRACNLAYRAMTAGSLPKHLDYGLLTIKDPYGNGFDETELREMHYEIKDENYRIFVTEQFIYLFNNTLFLRGTHAQEIFSHLAVKDSVHAFYLGRELSKAELALCLGKKYTQDYPLRWGYLNETEGKGSATGGGDDS